MAKNSSIEWTHHTFNPWWGCVKVSPACKICYAEAWAKRVGLEVWGGHAPRRFFGEDHWREPVRWNHKAKREGHRRRVFCASMADVFESRGELDPWRHRLWELIEATHWLDWLLLTKRPERIACCVPWRDTWPKNIWLGTTAENQRWAETRVPRLLRFPAAVLFVSCEPLLGPLDLRAWLRHASTTRRALDWVIAGGESGANARPMNPTWARDLRDQCIEARVPFHFKQWGHWRPESFAIEGGSRRIRVFDQEGRGINLVPLGKRASGRHLDGRTWDEFPEPHAALA